MASPGHITIIVVSITITDVHLHHQQNRHHRYADTTLLSGAPLLSLKEVVYLAWFGLDIG